MEGWIYDEQSGESGINPRSSLPHRVEMLMKILGVIRQWNEQESGPCDYAGMTAVLGQLLHAPFALLRLWRPLEDVFQVVGRFTSAKEMPHLEAALLQSPLLHIPVEEMASVDLPEDVLLERGKRFTLWRMPLLGKGKLLGEFTVLLPQGRFLRDPEIIEIYTAQAGLYLDKRKIEEELQESILRYRHAVEVSKAGTWEMNLSTGSREVSAQWAAILGYTQEEMESFPEDPLLSFSHPEEREMILERFHELRSGQKEQVILECRMRHKEGHWIETMDRGKVLSYDEAGKPLRLFGVMMDVSELKKMEKDYVESARNFQTLVENSHDILYRIERGGAFSFISPAFQSLLGYSAKEHIGKSFRVLVHPDDSEKMEAFFVKVRDTQDRQESPDFRLKDTQGHWHWFDTNVTPIWNSKGETVGYTGTAREITDKKLMEESLHLEKEIFKTTLMSVGDGIIATDVHGRVTIMNQVAEQLTGWTQKEAMGRKLELILSLRKDKTLEDLGNLALEAIQEERVLMLQDLLITTRNGLLVPIEESAAPIRDSSGEITGAVIVFWDITDKREKQKQVEYLSFHDHLTGLYNRRYMEMIIRRMDEAQIRPLALMVIDVNGLKLTNDAFGHDMGDLLLKKVAEIITSCVREEDVVCRVGGDEFVLVLPHTTEEEAECLRSRIKTLALESSMESVMISLAMGYAVKTDPEQELTEIQKLADNNMYKNKLKKGRIMRSRTIETVLRNINSKYDYEQIHTERVSQFCERIALALGLPPKDVEDAKISGSLHDIGKIMISPETLNKTEKLTDREWEEVRKHPMTGYQILRGVDEYSSLAKVILHHHERMDGKGYPDHLAGEEIPLLSRIITVADAFEAMTASRSYQKTKTLEEAIAELKRCRGTQFDPRIVDVFVEQVLKAGD